MDRRNRFSPDPVLQSLRARAVSQPPRSSGVPEYPAFAFPEVGTSPHQRSAQSPARERPWGQRLGRSPAAVSRMAQGQLRSASFSASEYPQENDIWRPSGSHFPSTFEDDEESLDAWTDNFTGQPRSWANTESRYRPHQIPGARSRSLVPTHGLSPTNFNGPPNDWNDRGLSISIDQRFLDGYPTSRLNGSRAHSLQGTSSMPAALAHRGSQQEISNLSPFSRDRLGSRLGNEELPGGYDPWSPIMSSMREEEPGSGATSRRHSVSVVQPRTRGVGFAASAAPSGDDGNTSSRMPVNASMAMFSDEELAGNFGVLNLNSNSSPVTDLLPTGTSSFPYSSSRLGVHAYGRARNNGMHGYPNIDTHLQRNRTPSDGRSPVGEATYGSGKATNMDQLSVALNQATRSGNASPLAASHSRDSSPGQDGKEPSPSAQGDHYINDPHPYDRQVSEASQGIGIDDVPRTSRLVLLEFKLGRKEVFFCDANLRVARGDRMIVEGDRGKDIGVVVDPDVERSWLTAQRHGLGADSMGSALHTKAKRAYAIAGPQEAQDLAKKEEDEQKALQLCQNKVRQKKLPMQVVDCEFQWDRRKLTFYFIAESRIDFRDLVRELFRLYKTDRKSVV